MAQEQDTPGETSGPVRRVLDRVISSRSRSSGTSHGLPDDLIDQLAHRLALICFVFAGVFFAADFVTLLIFSLDPWAALASDPGRKIPGAVSILISLAIGLAVRSGRVPRERVVDAALLFCTAGSYGIAFAQYWRLFQGQEIDLQVMTAFGLGWSAVWSVSFAALVPAPLAKLIGAVMVSVMAVPVVLGISVATGQTPALLGNPMFMGVVSFQYLLVGFNALWVGRTVYRLGTEVRKARELGSYRLIERIGAGGMGEVWRAEHRMLASAAAVKVIRVEALRSTSESADNARSRFRREASATAELRSPNTVELYDYGQAADGTLFYVMELLDGMNLESLVERHGPLPDGRVLSLLRQACRSLEEAHAKNLLHRDIKPANLFACRKGTTCDVVKVLDFGLVRRAGPSKDSTLLTVEGAIAGTPAYLSPEAILGERELDARSDLYALGCVGYWLLTGTRPFDHGSKMKTLIAHVNEAPEPPSKRCEVPISADLEATVLRLLAKEPSARPQSASALRHELAGCQAEKPWSEDDAEAWWALHRPSPTLLDEHLANADTEAPYPETSAV